MGQEVAALEKPCPPRPSPAHLLQEPQARQETAFPGSPALDPTATTATTQSAQQQGHPGS